jgi:hypothetical protein
MREILFLVPTYVRRSGIPLIFAKENLEYGKGRLAKILKARGKIGKRGKGRIVC